MRTYALYTVKNDIYYKVMDGEYYHLLLNKAETLNMQGKDCVIISGDPDNLPSIISGLNKNIIVEIYLDGYQI